MRESGKLAKWMDQGTSCPSAQSSPWGHKLLIGPALPSALADGPALADDTASRPIDTFVDIGALRRATMVRRWSDEFVIGRIVVTTYNNKSYEHTIPCPNTHTHPLPACNATYSVPHSRARAITT